MEGEIFLGLPAGCDGGFCGFGRIFALDRKFDEGEAGIVLVRLIEFLHRRNGGPAIRAIVIEKFHQCGFRVFRAGDKGDLRIEEGGHSRLGNGILAGARFLGRLLLLQLVCHFDQNFGVRGQITLHRRVA